MSPEPRRHAYRDAHTTLLRHLVRQLATRTLGLAVAITGLLLLLQLLRASDSLPPAMLQRSLLATIALLTLPALLGLALPLAALIATSATFAQLASEGTLTGWRALGRSPWTLLRAPVWLALATAAFTLVNTAWLAPAALSEAHHRFEAHYLQTVLDAMSQHMLQDDGDVVFQAPWREGTLEVNAHDLHLELNDRTVAVALDAPHITWTPDPANAPLSDAAALSLRADHLHLALQRPHERNHPQPVPLLETYDASQLTSLARRGDARASGQLAKRTVLIALSPLLTLLLAAYVLLPAARPHGVGSMLLLSLGAAVLVHASARGAELVTQSSVLGGALTTLLILAAAAFALGSRLRVLRHAW